jgi:hypothetical protein
MRAGQQLVDRNGVQVALFPMEYLDISQGENGSYSHQGTLNIDLLGWQNGVRTSHCPYYAPCDCRVVYHASYYNVWQSTNEVITPSGKKTICFVVMHDDNPPPLGTFKRQGEMIGRTGTNDPGGATTGDHLHLNTSLLPYAGWHQVPPANQWELINSSHVYNTFFINDTIIKNGYGYNWVKYTGGVIPGQRKKYKFKWVLYANKLRNGGR